jgi:hypothetical protein
MSERKPVYEFPVDILHTHGWGPIEAEIKRRSQHDPDTDGPGGPPPRGNFRTIYPNYDTPEMAATAREEMAQYLASQLPAEEFSVGDVREF